MRLKGKTAIVSGAASGFGEGIARLFAAEGCNVVVSDINDEGSTEVASSITDQGGNATAHHCDVTSGADWKDIVSATLERFGGLDILVNNAGMPQVNQPLLDVDEDTFDKIFDVNVKSIYHATFARSSGYAGSRRRINHKHRLNCSTSSASRTYLV